MTFARYSGGTLDNGRAFGEGRFSAFVTGMENTVVPSSVTFCPAVAGHQARCYNAMVAQRASGDATLAGIRRRGAPH